jgi:hypothetical protein
MTSVHGTPQEMGNYKRYGMSHGMSLSGWAGKCGSLTTVKADIGSN